MKTIILSVKERIQLMGILPLVDGRRIEAITLKSLMDKVTFTPEQISRYELRDLPNGQTAWNPKTGLDETFELTGEQVHMLKKSMVVLEERGGFKIDLLPLDTKINAL